MSKSTPRRTLSSFAIADSFDPLAAFGSSDPLSWRNDHLVRGDGSTLNNYCGAAVGKCLVAVIARRKPYAVNSC